MFCAWRRTRRHLTLWSLLPFRLSLPFLELGAKGRLWLKGPWCISQKRKCLVWKTITLRLFYLCWLLLQSTMKKKKKNALEIKQCLESLCYVFCLICSTNVIGFVAQRYKGTSRLLHLKSEKSSTQAQLPFVYMVIHYTPTNPLTHTNPWCLTVKQPNSLILYLWIPFGPAKTNRKSINTTYNHFLKIPSVTKPTLLSVVELANRREAYWVVVRFESRQRGQMCRRTCAFNSEGKAMWPFYIQCLSSHEGRSEQANV